VKKGEVLATAYTNKQGIDDVLKDIHDAFVLSKEKVVVHPIVHAYIHK
jgi:thymidine phosphorylase